MKMARASKISFFPAALATITTAAALAAASASSSRSTSACTPAETRSVFADFVSAFNRGDVAALDRLFAQPPEFGWYSSNPPGLRASPAAERRETLTAYFRRRHALGDRLRLLSFRLTGNTTVGNFVYRLRRSAADYHRGAPFRLQGKGTAICDSDGVRFVVLSLGGPGSA